MTKNKEKSYIAWIANLLGFGLGLLIVWLIFSITPKDVWTLGKGLFSSEEKLVENWPKVEVIDNKVKKGIAAKPLNWVSNKFEKEASKDMLKGDLTAPLKAMRLYSGILLAIWFLSLVILWSISYLITYWMIDKFIWKIPKE